MARIKMYDAVSQSWVYADTSYGKDGSDGKSAYDYAKDAGYTGTEAEFATKLAEEYTDGISATHSWNGTTLTITSASGTSSADLKGAKGDTGEQGIQGERGPKGDKGDQGEQGPKGDKGDKGDPGEKGSDGTGVTILGSFDTEDALNAAHPVGAVGESYLVSGYLYVWSATENAWTNVGNIQGPKGDKGDQGIQGIQGIQGPAGADGKDGAKGETGEQGAKGIGIKSITIMEVV